MTLLGALSLGAPGRPQGSVGQHLAAPKPLLPRLPEAPPAHPPAAPLAACPGACSAGPRGIPNVYLHSGEVHLQEVDLVLPGRGLDFVWARTYRSRIGADTPQGNGWSFSYDLRVETEGSAVRLLDGNGRSDLYHPRPDGTYAAVQFSREGHFEPRSASFVLEFADRSTWTFHRLDGSPQAGKVKTIADRNGNALSFGYDGLGRLFSVVDTLGRLVQVDHDSSGRIASLTDHVGRQVVYEYYGVGEPGGSPGDLKAARSPIVVGTPNGNDFPAGKTTTYSYSEGFADERLNHNLLSVTDPEGHTWLVNEYSDEEDPDELLFDRLVRQTRGDPGDVIDVDYELVRRGPSGILLAIVNDRVGNVREYEYDLAGRCLALRALTGRADPDLPTTSSANRPEDPLRPDDPPFFETRWSYDADSRPTRVRHPNGNATRFVRELELDPASPPRSRGNLRERHRLPGAHTPVGDQESLGETFEYADGFGACCGQDFVTRHVDPRGEATEHDYDAAGNRIQTRHRSPSIVEDFTYNAFGQMTNHVHPDNGSLWRQLDVWTYYGPSAGHQNGYVESKIVDAEALSLTTTWTYDSAGNVTQVTDARGNATTMVVNALNQVVRRISPPVDTRNGAQVVYEVDTWYDADDNVVRVDRKNFDDRGILDRNSLLTTSFDHDVLDRCTRMTQEVHLTRDVVTEHEYDANRNRTLTRFGEATAGNQSDNVVRWSYDERDLLFRSTRGDGGPDRSTTQHDHDGNGNTVRVTAGLEGSDPQVTAVTYDAYDRPVESVDPMGNVTSRGYDGNGNPVHVQVDGELCDAPGGVGNLRLFEASLAYDAMDRHVQRSVAHFDPATQAPIGDGEATTAWTWTDRSRIATVTDDNGHAKLARYDTAGRRECVQDALGNEVRAAYDGNHNVVQVVEMEKSDSGAPDGLYASFFFYDAVDRRVSEFDPLENEVETGYDSRGNPTTVVDAKGNVTTRVYDGLNRLVSKVAVLTHDGTGAGDVVGQVTSSWEWDDSSRLVARVDDNGNRTVHAYDGLNRRIGTVHADGLQETLAYDVHGNPVERLDPNDTLVASTYDSSNRIATRSIVPGPGVSDDTTCEVWKHDGLSRLVHAEDDDSLVTRAWDSLSNVVRETQDGQSLVGVHDGVGNELGLTYPGGKSVARTYDAVDRVKTVTDEGPVVAYDYVGPRRVEARSAGKAQVTSAHGYDGARRVASVDHGVGAGALDRRSFEWDETYNKTKATDDLFLIVPCVRDYTYDSRHRLVHSLGMDSAGAVVRDVSYLIDGVDNRVSVDGGEFPGDYVMDPKLPEPADRQMNQYTSSPSAGLIAYDGNGNQVARGVGEGLVYDYRDRLVFHEGPSGSTAFAYDALGRNIAKVRGPGAADTVRYHYHGMDVVEERDGNDEVLATHVHGRPVHGFESALGWYGFNPQPEPPVEHELVQMDLQGERFLLFADDLGSTRVVTDAAGGVVERYDYDEFGAPRFFDPDGGPLPGSTIGGAWLFKGLRWDEETGLLCDGGRFLDPLLGQFLGRSGTTGPPGNGRTHSANNPQSRGGGNPEPFRWQDAGGVDPTPFLWGRAGGIDPSPFRWQDAGGIDPSPFRWQDAGGIDPTPFRWQDAGGVDPTPFLWQNAGGVEPIPFLWQDAGGVEPTPFLWGRAGGVDPVPFLWQNAGGIDPVPFLWGRTGGVSPTPFLWQNAGGVEPVPFRWQNAGGVDPSPFLWQNAGGIEPTPFR